MFADYRSAILKDYIDKCARGELPLNLKRPTAARLRDECLELIPRRCTDRDLMILRDFFGYKESPESFMLHIKKVDPDKFRPLVNWLKGKSRHTSEQNIELLAWLIDYNPRPYVFEYSGNQLVDYRPQKAEAAMDNESLIWNGKGFRLELQVFDSDSLKVSVKKVAGLLKINIRQLGISEV